MSETTYKPSEMAEAIRNLDPTNIHLAGIEVVTPPDKTKYEVGDTFDPTGIVVEGNYSQNFKKNVTAGTSYSPTSMDSASIDSVTATYSERGITKYTNIGIIVYPCKIVTWADGTDAEIAAMVEAADDGKMDLTDFWDIGDEREVSLSAMSATGVGESHVAQTVTMVLVAKDTGVQDSTNPCYNYQYVTPTSGRRYPSFIVQQKNGLANGTTRETGYMNSTSTNIGSWNGCARRTWCNNVFKNAIPSMLVDIFKQVDVKTAETYNGSTMQTSQDYFFLPAAAEVFKGDSTYGTGGSAGQATAYSNLTEFNALSCWQYYETTTNRIKKAGTSGSAYYWLERSPHYNSTNRFCTVDSSGNANYTGASGTCLIAPAGCI